MYRDIYTTHQIAKLCKVDVSTVTNWINKGKLKAYKTPGKHRRIKKEDLIKFLNDYNMPVFTEMNNESKSILIVDDERKIVDIMKRALKKNSGNVEIESAYDGFEAGRKIMKMLLDLIILDIQLPGIDGHEVLKNIKENKRLEGIKILAISGKNIEENRERVLNMGADDFLAKPFEMDEMLLKVSKLLKVA